VEKQAHAEELLDAGEVEAARKAFVEVCLLPPPHMFFLPPSHGRAAQSRGKLCPEICFCAECMNAWYFDLGEIRWPQIDCMLYLKLLPHIHTGWTNVDERWYAARGSIRKEGG